MSSTGFRLAEEQRHRLAQIYCRRGGSMFNLNPGASKGAKGLDDVTERVDDRGLRYSNDMVFLEAGGGMVGTISDYSRFCMMCLRGGELDGARIVSRKPLDWMMVNHLEDDKDMAQAQQGAPGAGYSETSQSGSGFGLGWSVAL